jgi:hypothetical protein
LGCLVPDVEVALAATPDCHLAIGIPQNGGGVGFDVALVHRRRAEFSLYHQIGFLESFIQISQFEKEVVGDIAGFTAVIVGPQPTGTDVDVRHVGQPLV